MSGTSFASAEEVPEEAREPLADLLLVLADNKRLLGMRYADWILGAPALEAGISCSAMAQDEWGHGRILYAMLREFGRDAEQLEHGREPGEYRNCELLDRAPDGWPGLLALNLLLDSALTVQFEALRESAFEPIQYKVSKLLDEERFHFEHGKGWTARLSATGKGQDALREAFEPAWEACLRWFGESDDPTARALEEAGIVDAGPDELRLRWVARVAPVVDDVGLDLAETGGDGRWSSTVEPRWNGWDAPRRRPESAPGPDARTIERVRGDRNRELLAD